MHKMKFFSVVLSLFAGLLYGMLKGSDESLTLTQQVVVNRTLVYAVLEGSSSNIIENLLFLRADVNTKIAGKPPLDLLSDKYDATKDAAEKEKYVNTMAILMGFAETDKEKLTSRFSGKMLSECYNVVKKRAKDVEEQKNEKEKSSL